MKLDKYCWLRPVADLGFDGDYKISLKVLLVEVKVIFRLFWPLLYKNYA